ncbi:hypothetical protein, partial [Clostridium estertheticum]
LVLRSNKQWKYIVCRDDQRLNRIVEMAAKLKLTIPFPIIVRELPLRSINIKSVLVDDIDDVLEYMIGKKIDYATTSCEVEEITEQEQISDEEIDNYSKFSDREKQIIKEEYAKHPKGFYPNPRCALY